MSEQTDRLAEIRERWAKTPDGPWFVGHDDAIDCPDHANSGLALVDTGRSADWPIARLCEWPTATAIAHSKTDVTDLLVIIDAQAAAPSNIEYALGRLAVEALQDDFTYAREFPATANIEFDTHGPFVRVLANLPEKATRAAEKIQFIFKSAGTRVVENEEIAGIIEAEMKG